MDSYLLHNEAEVTAGEQLTMVKEYCYPSTNNMGSHSFSGLKLMVILILSVVSNLLTTTKKTIFLDCDHVYRITDICLCEMCFFHDRDHYFSGFWSELLSPTVSRKLVLDTPMKNKNI